MTRVVKVNRAPVLTLWAATVARRLGHGEDAALSLGAAIAGTAAQAKARRLGIAEPGEGQPHAAPHATVHLMGREVPVEGEGASLRATGGGRAQSPDSTRRYVARAFGDDLPAVRDAMEKLADSLPPKELDRIAFRLYEAFRPEVPPDVRGWGAKGELHIGRIESAGG